MYSGLRSKVGIIGVGLIGGSIGMRLRFSGFASHVVGIGRSLSRLRKAKELGAVDSFSTSYSALKDCDIVIICLPVDLISSSFDDLEGVLNPSAIVTDVGSVKLPIVEAYKAGNYSFDFVPAHPIAGSHISGIVGAYKSMFMGKSAIICPVKGRYGKEAASVVRTMYNFLGMNVEYMDAAKHDKLLAYASHLPHLVSFALNDSAGRYNVSIGAQSLKDMLRVSFSSKDLWNSILMANKENVLKAGNDFSGKFNRYMDKIERGRSIASVGSKSVPVDTHALEVVAIDGPAGSGKSTISRMLAEKLNWKLIDTGAMYRAVTLGVMEKSIALDDVEKVLRLVDGFDIQLSTSLPQKVFLNGKDISSKIRRPDVTKNVFYLAREPRIREKMVKMQRRLAMEGRCVIEGRDITTVVVPDARYKFYLDAMFAERLTRRRRDLEERGMDIPDELLMDMLERDANDLCRDVGPLRKAEDAVYLDTTALGIDEVVNVLFFSVLQRQNSK